ncbi:uncharacterized protein MONOS_15029 [Monocercomonoides exilis]|uniref:uncharacterized protein n=1 Tax=Monocercomonoides exilis TaxID=2049356 RepID=UPI003559BCB5|nr:hypothetical protein MONOS_15029 [Monocercomonoides exilis]|eukprot:MONOS_15029.1-p1 / transcript=MONOS_15029.1 / gene=MONOS_15029 / organism=Monocercomonoides_exilis_PA203 / gene_product=unspecified product / transcript_product=unspecified product / location=Mono_scaffold01130:8890-9849(+) / protein_length=235 / sequence_SO=supercontig / SO=protein_coding / is_pseudo=false
MEQLDRLHEEMWMASNVPADPACSRNIEHRKWASTDRAASSLGNDWQVKFDKSAGRLMAVEQPMLIVLCAAEASMCSKPVTKDRQGSFGDPHRAMSNPASDRWISLDEYEIRKQNRSASQNVWSLPTNSCGSLKNSSYGKLKMAEVTFALILKQSTYMHMPFAASLFAKVTDSKRNGCMAGSSSVLFAYRTFLLSALLLFHPLLNSHKAALKWCSLGRITPISSLSSQSKVQLS